MRTPDPGKCETCSNAFGYILIHSGFNDSQYAYCDHCGMTAILDHYSPKCPKPLPAEPYRTISETMEPLLQPC